MRSLSQTLTALIGIAEDMMTRPIRPLPPSYGGIAAEVRRAHGLPAELTRTTRAGVVMCEALEASFGVDRDRWQMLIGATLPLLRDEAFQAFRNERQVALSATEEFQR
jgi:hypothetical protein